MKQVFLILIISLLYSCKVKQDLITDKCDFRDGVNNNEFRDITYEKYVAIENTDTLSINQLKYNCVFTEFLLKKVMFDKFGKWDEARYKQNEKHPILVWRSVQLFPNNDTHYMVATTGGGEDVQKIYTSVMVFKDGKDLLTANSRMKNKLTEYFTELIQKNDINNKRFFPIYWRDVDPVFYRKSYLRK